VIPLLRFVGWLVRLIQCVPLACWRKKKARIARIRAYRNYYCHAVLMALNQTGALAGGSLIVQFAMQRVVLQRRWAPAISNNGGEQQRQSQVI
jgi:hypothetical protein